MGLAYAAGLVRNSIWLVDFIEGEVKSGRSLEEAAVRAGAIRAKLIALTAQAALMLCVTPSYECLRIRTRRPQP